MTRFFVKMLAICAVFIATTTACSNHDRAARAYLAEAEAAYEIGNFPLAMLKIDSIRILFPRAFPEINAGIALRQRVRMAENVRNIAFADSMLYVKNAIFAEQRQLFDFVRDDELHAIGEYYPRIYPHHASLNRSGIRSGVTERGAFFIESVLISNPVRHNRIRLSLRDGSFVETLPVTDEGFNHRFTTNEGSFEIVRFRADDENGIAKFVETFQNEPITIHFIGNRTITTTLSRAEIQGIIQSLEFSILMTDIHRLEFERDRSEVLIRYLESRM